LVIERAYEPAGQASVSSEWFVAMLVAMYSVGAYCDLRAATIRLGAAVSVILAVNVVNVITDHSTVGESAGVYPFVFTLWGAGVAVRRMRFRASRLEDRVGALARERDQNARAA